MERSGQSGSGTSAPPNGGQRWSLVLPPGRGRGYGTRAAERFAMSDNIASIRLPKRTGFRPQDVVRAYRGLRPRRVELAVFGASPTRSRYASSSR
jgi:hypothetical protein